MSDSPPLSIFWAKLGKPDPDKPVAYHPLICHMLDVAAVAERIWDEVLSPYARQHLARGLGIDDVAAARRWVAFLAGAHDLGKACPPFERRWGVGRVSSLYGGALAALAPANEEFDPHLAPHGVVTGVTLGGILCERNGLPPKLARRLAQVVGGHHGYFPDPGERKKLRDTNGVFPVATGNEGWADARLAATAALAEALGLAGAQPPTRLDDAAIMSLAGITSVADWIGSNEDFFPYLIEQPAELPPAIHVDAYFDRSLASATTALNELRWGGWKPAAEPLSFARLFPAIAQPRDLQRRVERIAGDLASDLPALVIVEAPMGEGKTEAALYAADRWGVDPGPRGFYVAMPTMATSNQMFSRVHEFLRGRYKGETVTLNLLHGHATLSAELQSMLKDGIPAHSPDRFTPGQICDDSRAAADGASAEVVAGSWFTAGKRGLLPPFGVGTIDQALLGVLATKHQFVRLGALAGKTVIFDEVHAYDTYMSTILDGLLSWLSALGSPVILLSATLPAARRNALLRAYAAGLQLDAPHELPATPYPRISWLARGGAGAESIETSARIRRTFALRWVNGALPEGDEPFALGEQLGEALREGGCAAVICNTVQRARETYAALKSYFPDTADDGRPELELFHARYRFLDRDRREKDALLRFGKPNSTVEREDGTVGTVHRPRRAVLVATQVIEQSLDLDFDLMVSQMAPADLLLQRSGRLHRHDRPDRPPPLREPQLWVCAPEAIINDVPRFDRGTTFIYAEHVLLRSWLTLSDRAWVRVPEQVEEIVEGVYGAAECPNDATPALSEAWARTLAKRSKLTEDNEFTAIKVQVPLPNADGDLLDWHNDGLQEDAPQIALTLQARTRLAEPSVNVIVLTPEEAEQDKRLPSREGKPSVQRLQFLLRHSVSLTSRWVWKQAGALRKAPRASGSATLRDYRYVVLDAAGACAPAGTNFRILLDAEIGVVVEKLSGGQS